MKWVLNNTCNQSHYWSLSGSDRKAELRYNGEAHSLRLNAADRRLFFLERSGLRQKIVFKTEYSVVIGESHFRSSEAGTLLLDGEKFSFQTSAGTIRLFNRYGQLLAETFIETPERLDLYEFSALLFSLGKVNSEELVA